MRTLLGIMIKKLDSNTMQDIMLELGQKMTDKEDLKNKDTKKNGKSSKPKGEADFWNQVRVLSEKK